MTSPTIEAVTTSAAPAPVGPYNQAVKAGGVLYCSGQIALDPATGAMVGDGDVEAETRQVLANLKAVLQEAGCTPQQVVRTTVFSPEDLELVKAAPSVRRDFVDDALVALQPKLDVLCSEIEKVLRQRNSLLKQAGGRLSPDIASTLDVWDAKLSELGTELGDERARLIAQISPRVSKAYEELAEKATPIGLVYEPEWRRIGLASELQTCRMDDIRRGTSTVGPHRDDIELLINGLPARTHASQGEQRTLALAMRLAVHRMVTEEFGSPPVLILDDVLSELDPGRAAALLRHFPEGQVLITTAGYLPEAAHPDRIVRIQQGAVVQDSTTKDSFPT